MRTQPASIDDHSAGIDVSVNEPPGVARRIGARLLHEVREALPPTLFFFVGFNFIVLTTNLLVADYLIAVSNFMLATLAASCSRRWLRSSSVRRCWSLTICGYCGAMIEPR